MMRTKGTTAISYQQVDGTMVSNFPLERKAKHDGVLDESHGPPVCVFFSASRR